MACFAEHPGRDAQQDIQVTQGRHDNQCPNLLQEQSMLSDNIHSGTRYGKLAPLKRAIY